MNRFIVSSISKGIRHYSTSKAVKYSQFGNAGQVLKVVQEEVNENLQPQEVLIEMIHAPINPVDFNLASGTYGFQPKLPSVAGSEGVGVVKKVGSKVQQLKANDLVVPVISSQVVGTWRTKGVFNEKQFHKVPSDIPAEYLASVSINPTTAYRLLEDFVKLQAGDVIIQNASSGMVGLSVIQMAKAKGVKTINVIRNGADHDEQVELLKGLGGDIVVTEDYIRTQAFQKLISDLPKPKLALNAVGGLSATELARILADNGTLVTYGGMSREPVIIPTSHLIFRNIQSKGFWLNNWYSSHTEAERQEMFDKIFTMIRSKSLKLYIEKHKFSDFESALIRSQEPGKGRKILLDLQL
ncbi:trans-2-enoyl-CoA reductase [Tieghemostelium lacteum]|uniref:enoyl-[acyl-carrier-protein] reductase n=1 Tax=Tieghemostelium lacteum TaxID=361077 RepID=A0A152A8K6_TIELA|nr:trans-2-enoyl-CoA reductase [Tieghemostelium lacteum]|eukprot:KYR02553.1 trans-2-enoyl-CoA reductase [Tieghemostelium lacteum]